MKTSKTIRPAHRVDRTVGWWSTLLLVGLGAVIVALFLSARLLLSLANEPGSNQTRASATPLSHVAGMLPLRDDRTVRSRSNAQHTPPSTHTYICMRMHPRRRLAAHGVLADLRTVGEHRRKVRLVLDVEGLRT